MIQAIDISPSFLGNPDLPHEYMNEAATPIEMEGTNGQHHGSILIKTKPSTAGAKSTTCQ